MRIAIRRRTEQCLQRRGAESGVRRVADPELHDAGTTREVARRRCMGRQPWRSGCAPLLATRAVRSAYQPLT
jgi:hypothetical protein